MFRRKRLRDRGLKAWMLFAYRQRVFHYMQRKLLHRVGTDFFERLREKFFEIKTESIKEQKAVD